MGVVLFWFGFAIAVGVLASNRGRSGFAWFLISVVISPLLGFIFVLVMENLSAKQDLKNQLYFDSFNQFQCPYCLERINKGSQICRFCRSDVSEFISNTRMDGSSLGGVGVVIKRPPNIKLIVSGFLIGFGILGYSIYDTHENGGSNFLLIVLSVGILIRMILELTRLKNR